MLIQTCKAHNLFLTGGLGFYLSNIA